MHRQVINMSLKVAASIKDLSSQCPVYHSCDGSVLGWWDGAIGSYQAVLLVPPCGNECTVIILDGSDYGGGVQDLYEYVPYEAVQNIIDSADRWGSEEMTKLRKVCEAGRKC